MHSDHQIAWYDAPELARFRSLSGLKIPCNPWLPFQVGLCKSKAKAVNWQPSAESQRKPTGRALFIFTVCYYVPRNLLKLESFALERCNVSGPVTPLKKFSTAVRVNNASGFSRFHCYPFRIAFNPPVYGFTSIWFTEHVPY